MTDKEAGQEGDSIFRNSISLGHWSVTQLISRLDKGPEYWGQSVGLIKKSWDLPLKTWRDCLNTVLRWEGWWDGSEDKGTCHQAQQPEFDLHDPHGKRRKMTRWLWPLVSALGDTCRQTCKFKTSLVYTASSRTSRAIEGPDLKKPKERKKRKENCHSSCPLTICMHLSILRSTVYKHTHTHTQ